MHLIDDKIVYNVKSQNNCSVFICSSCSQHRDMQIILILTSLLYFSEAVNLFPDKLPNIKIGTAPSLETSLFNFSNPFNIPGIAKLEKMFLPDWLNFEKTYNKTYSKEEEPTRKLTFFQNVYIITKLASDQLVDFTLRINEFTDLTFEQFNEQFNGFNRLGKFLRRLKSFKGEVFKLLKSFTLPQSVDWRKRGVVSPVKEQKRCAGCWAFSVAGCVEGHVAIQTGQLEEVSIQQLIDCATGDQYDNFGCSGGITESGFEYVQDNGISSNSKYPYISSNGHCPSDIPKSIATIKSYVRIPQGDEEALAYAVANIGPISASIHVPPKAQFYGDDIFNDPQCYNSLEKLSHSVLVVGYGQQEDGRKYWLVKNSYGESWGAKGYLKLAKDEANACGIATFALYPKV